MRKWRILNIRQILRYYLTLGMLIVIGKCTKLGVRVVGYLSRTIESTPTTWLIGTKEGALAIGEKEGTMNRVSGEEMGKEQIWVFVCPVEECNWHFSMAEPEESDDIDFAVSVIEGHLYSIHGVKVKPSYVKKFFAREWKSE